MDRLSHSVHRSGHAIDLSPKEFGLLEFLMRHAGHPVSRSTIVEQVWRLNVETMTNVVDVYVNYLRRKVDAGYDRPLIRTIRCTGYQIGTGELVSWRDAQADFIFSTLLTEMMLPGLLHPVRIGRQG